MNATILLVDDEPGSLKLLKDILTAEGYTVRPFNNGELALRSVLIAQPELILLDIRMPHVDGFEVCRRLKQQAATKEIPVIFISAAADLEDKVRAFQTGGVDYIVKPFHKDEVLARVNTHVRLNRSLREIKQMEESLRNSETSLRMAQAIAHLGHWEMDINTGGVTWSDEMYRILGLQPHSAAPSYESLLQAVHPEDRELVKALIDSTPKGQSFEIDHRILLADGTVREVHAKAEVIGRDEGRQPKVIGTLQEVPPPTPAKLLGVVQDVTERRELERQLEQLANTDSLTGCATRRYFMALAEKEFARARRYGSHLSVLMLDLDHFKEVNDRHGHLVGDRTLAKFAEVCRTTLRDVDLVGRLGGEEFAVLLTEIGDGEAAEVAERVRQAVAGAEIVLPAGKPPLRFTASIGVATLAPGDAGINALLERADKALYCAKNTGRNKVCVAAAQGA